MLKYSKQREAIKSFLAGRYDHPTAETVYLGIKEEFPNISLGTVYRNLSLLSDIGEIQKLSTGIGPDRFDGNAAPFFYLLTIYTLYIQPFWDITVDVKVQKLHNLS